MLRTRSKKNNLITEIVYVDTSDALEHNKTELEKKLKNYMIIKKG